ncbi:MAG: ABC transporter permease [Pirellulales bacterium]|nr:ABC transporter permease [Pirellulales bacterium]
MSLWKIAWRSLAQRRLASILTAFSMALGVALVIAVLVIHSVVERQFTQTATGYDLIVGAKGGRLQLVLNTVYHLSTPIENVPWKYYEEFLPGGKYASQVSVAIPYCLGDNYQGYRVVGTVPAMFEQLEYAPGDRYQFREGKNFHQDDFFAAVVGDQVARRTGLKVGDEFQPTHGVTSDDGHKHDAFHVVGILAPTGTPNDRALFVNMEGFYLLDGHAKEAPKKPKPAEAPKDEHVEGEHSDAEHGDHEHGDHEQGEHAEHEHGEEHPAEGHEHEGEHDHAHEGEHAEHDHDHDHEHDHAHDEHGHHHEPLPVDQREVTAILLRTSTPLAALSLPRAVNKEPFAQAVLPAREIFSLFEGIVANLERILLLLAWLIVVVASIGVMVSIYNSMAERQREIAVMRALGARRGTVLTIVLFESILLSLLGGLLGVVLGHGLIALLSPIITAQTGVSIGAFQFGLSSYQLGNWQIDIIWELALVPILIVLAALAGFLPAVAAYRTDVAKALTATP